MVRLPKSKFTSSIDLLQQTFSAQQLFRPTSYRAKGQTRSMADAAAACGSLQAFVNEVKAQRGKKITDGQADDLLQVVAQLQADLSWSCSAEEILKHMGLWEVNLPHFRRVRP